jgi:hypothetical protein
MRTMDDVDAWIEKNKKPCTCREPGVLTEEEWEAQRQESDWVGSGNWTRGIV